jgi:uncharacterized Zn-binding protein involved in type VI secretion
MPKITQGSPNFSIEGLPAARVGDACDNNSGTGMIVGGSGNFRVDQKSAARESDPVTKSIGIITQGSPTFFVNGQAIARVGDKT